MEKLPLGSVIEGSLKDGLIIKLHPHVSVEKMRVGEFLVIQGQISRFFCILTDVVLEVASPRIISDPPIENALMTEILAGNTTFTTLELEPIQKYYYL